MPGSLSCPQGLLCFPQGWVCLNKLGLAVLPAWEMESFCIWTLRAGLRPKGLGVRVGSGGTAALSSLPSGKEEFRPAETRGWSLVSHPGLQTGFSSLHRHRWSPESTEQEPESSLC